jgi:hypothetical protein
MLDNHLKNSGFWGWRDDWMPGIFFVRVPLIHEARVS